MDRSHNIERGRILTCDQGFTLIELLVALAMSALVLAAIFRISLDQQKVHITQNQVTELQQSVRAAFDLMTRDIRMAGYNPTRVAPAGCVSATDHNFHFRMDLNADGDCSDVNEDVTYSFDQGQGAGPLLRKSTTNDDGSAIIDHVEAIEFNYVLADGTESTAPPSPAQIRLVEVSLLVRTGNQDNNYRDTKIYTTGSQVTWGPFNDHYRRRFLCVRILCQNMGL